MGKIVTVEYVDDLDGMPINAKSVDTVEFAYRGHTYTLVLTAENGAQFDKDIARYLRAAKKAATRDAQATRKDSRPEPRRSTKPKTRARAKAVPRKTTPTVELAGATSAQAIREWASANGHKVSPRGRIAAAVVEAYDAAH